MSEDFSSNVENELAAAEKELAAIDARRKLLLERIRSLRDRLKPAANLADLIRRG